MFTRAGRHDPVCHSVVPMMGMGLGGMGSGNPRLRYFRLALLAAVLLAGLAFHHAGPEYAAVRVAYYAAIVGFIGYALYRRSRAQPSRHDEAGHRPAPPDATSLGGPGAGWYPDQSDPNRQHYWDGRQWTVSRLLDETGGTGT